MYSKHIGQRYGTLTVVAAELTKSKGGHDVQKLTVRCDCGNQYTTHTQNITRADRPTCRACAKNRNAVASMCGWKHPLHGSWQAMVDRCYNPDAQHYRRYGGRGIKVCDRWLGTRPNGELRTIDGFHAFCVDMGLRPKGYSLDRMDNNGNYEPGNCRWATKREQVRNRG